MLCGVLTQGCPVCNHLQAGQPCAQWVTRLVAASRTATWADGAHKLMRMGRVGRDRVNSRQHLRRAGAERAEQGQDQSDANEQIAHTGLLG